MLLRTSRLLLRSWKESDLEPFAALNADPKVREFFPSLLTAEESHASVQYYQKELNDKGYGLWALELLENGAFIGFCGLHVLQQFESHFTPCVEIGWRLAYPFWNKGYATEAALESLRCGFEDFDLHEIFSFTTLNNIRSQKVMQKIGMHRNVEDDFDHPKIEVGHPLRRHALYRLLKSEWLKKQRR